MEYLLWKAKHAMDAMIRTGLRGGLEFWQPTTLVMDSRIVFQLGGFHFTFKDDESLINKLLITSNFFQGIALHISLQKKRNLYYFFPPTLRVAMSHASIYWTNNLNTSQYDIFDTWKI